VPEALSVFILPPSREALESRMRNRGQDSEQTIARRLAAAREEMSHYDEFDFVIVNEDFETARARCRRSSSAAASAGTSSSSATPA
jgi:guanylate kinase